MQVSLELGRQIVYGAIGYARELGFAPHPDFGRDGETNVHLRAVRRRAEGIRKLRRGRGDGNYDFVHMISG